MKICIEKMRFRTNFNNLYVYNERSLFDSSSEGNNYFAVFQAGRQHQISRTNAFRPSTYEMVSRTEERKTTIKASFKQDALILPGLSATPAIHLQLGLSVAEQTRVL